MSTYFLRLGIYQYAEAKEERFRKSTLAFFKSFTLPWFAVLGAHKSLDHGLGFFSAVLVGVLAMTAGGVLIDLFSGVTPEVVTSTRPRVATRFWRAGLAEVS